MKESKGTQQLEFEEQRTVNIGDCPCTGLVSIRGRRQNMEDAATIAPDFLNDQPGKHITSSFHFFGVYDGHGGCKAANICKDRCHKILAEQVKEAVDLELEEMWERAMVSSFLKLDGEIDGRCESCVTCLTSTHPCVQPLAGGDEGSTAVVAVVSCTKIFVANCGDSRIVLGRNGQTVPLSYDHKPDNPEEFERITKLGGVVIRYPDPRVMGKLNMSRALGDHNLKPYVIPNPDVKCIPRTDEDEFLVLATDGLWNVLTNEEVCNITRQCLAGKCSNQVLEGLLGKVQGTENAQARLAAACLTKVAYRRNSRDNISVLVVDFKNTPSSSPSLSEHGLGLGIGTSTKTE